MKPVAALLASLLVCASIQAQQKRVYISPDDHTDYFWTADASVYQQAFLDTLDYYLALADATAGNPPEFQSRWSCDGSLWLWTYERNRPPAQFERASTHLSSRPDHTPVLERAKRPPALADIQRRPCRRGFPAVDLSPPWQQEYSPLHIADEQRLHSSGASSP